MPAVFYVPRKSRKWQKSLCLSSFPYFLYFCGTTDHACSFFMSRRNRGNGRNFLYFLYFCGTINHACSFLCPAEIAEMAEISLLVIFPLFPLFLRDNRPCLQFFYVPQKSRKWQKFPLFPLFLRDNKSCLQFFMSRGNRGNGRNLFACHLSLISFISAGQQTMPAVFLCPAEIAEMAEISFISFISAGQ